LGTMDDIYTAAAKVSFVSGHNGTTALEVMAISLAPQLGVLVSALFALLVGAMAAAGQSKKTSSVTESIASRLPAAASGVGKTSHNSGATEFLLLGLPVLLCLTCCSEHWHLVLASVTGAALSLGVAVRRLLTSPRGSRASLNRQSFAHTPAEAGDGASVGGMHYVTNYRASMLYVTALCILAVDFPVFPRRFAKAENFGFGLMDIGVGSFVFSAGLVALEARKGQDVVSRNRLGYLAKSFKESIPMILLGFVRYLSLKGSGYHTHESEYGLHWNFFFTMAITKVVSSLVYTCGISVCWSWLVSFGVIFVHEMALGVGLGKWIIDEGPRHDLLSANREGVVSCFGYLAVYFAGVSWGSLLFKPKSITKDYITDAKSLGLWSLVMWATLFYSSEGLSMSPSRRLVNWPYFVWMVAYNLTLLWLCLCTDLVANYARVQIQVRQKLSNAKAKGQPAHKVKDLSGSADGDGGLDVRVPQLYQAIAYNSLGFFLLANVLTGLVNLSIQTINSNGTISMLILITYLLVLQTVSIVFYHKHWRVKLS